jgi:hypothetical protein
MSSDTDFLTSLTKAFDPFDQKSKVLAYMILE